MFKLTFSLLFLSTLLVMADEFDLLDKETPSDKTTSNVEKEFLDFEHSLKNTQDIDKVQPSAGFEELDKQSDENSLEG